MLAPLLFAAIQVIAPANGAVLRGGHFCTLAWDARNLPSSAEEWEAFLSVDGGKFYSVRLTPHLDIDVRRFEVLIPNVDSDDVRILIRTGDERNETIIPMPQRFRIRAEAAEVRTVSSGGEGPESARPNEPPVVQWSVGDHVESASSPASMVAVTHAAGRSIDIAVASYRIRRGGQTILSVRTGRISRPPQSPRTANLLQKISRLNV